MFGSRRDGASAALRTGHSNFRAEDFSACRMQREALLPGGWVDDRSSLWWARTCLRQRTHAARQMRAIGVGY
jgi:hypothetical protein